MIVDLSPAELGVLARWALSGQVSIPARTIAALAMGLDESWFDYPQSGRDIGSCALLLREVPALVDALPIVASRCPGWAPIIGAWDELVRLHDQDRHEPPRYERIRPAPGWLAERVLVNRRACYDRLQELLPACRQAAGRSADAALVSAELPTVSMPESRADNPGLSRFLHGPPVPTPR